MVYELYLNRAVLKEKYLLITGKSKEGKVKFYSMLSFWGISPSPFLGKFLKKLFYVFWGMVRI